MPGHACPGAGTDLNSVCQERDKNKQKAESANTSAACLLLHHQDFRLDDFLLCFMRNKFSSISGLAFFRFFLFFFLLVPSRVSCAYTVLFPWNAWKIDVCRIVLPFPACFLHPLGKSSSKPWLNSALLLRFSSLGFSARDILIFL